jgi:flagellar motor switch protein FliM
MNTSYGLDEGDKLTVAEEGSTFDFRKSDRISKSQLRAINLLHDHFVRCMVASLSAYLRTSVVVDLISVAQMSYAEFLEVLPSPTCIASLSLTPYGGSGVLDLGPALALPIVEMILGGTGKSQVNLQRPLTDIEQNLIEGILRIVLNDLRDAWASVAPIEFAIQSKETEPQFLQAMAPGEALVSICIPMRIGEGEGSMNIAIPSLMIKMMRHKFEQQSSVRKAESTPDGQEMVLNLIQDSQIMLELQLNGSSLSRRDVLSLDPGDILAFDASIDAPLDCLLNGYLQCKARMVTTGRRRALVIDHARR